MSKAIRVHETGGPEVLRWEEVDVPAPGEGEVLLRHTAVGLNYIDVYHRTGLYPVPSLPFTPGMEAAGVIEEVGPGCDDLKPGDRVAYASLPLGAYAERRVMPAGRLVKLPDAIDERQAAAMMLKGMTAEYLLHRTFPVAPGHVILVHAAAGGVGSILCQWAKHKGATVIGTVGNDEKARRAKAKGCDHVIIYSREDFLERVREITDGIGVDVVYDSVGKATFDRSLDCLKPLGMMVSYGQSSGKVPPLDLGILSAKGSLFVTRPTMVTYTARREDLLASAGKLFEMVAQGIVTVDVAQTYALADAEQAHRDLEGRRTQGSTLLIP